MCFSFCWYTSGMEIKLEVNPLSVNDAYRGRRFKSKDYLIFERDICIVLPFAPNPATTKDEVFVRYIFHLKNYGAADTFNYEKILSDMLVKRGYFLDDRYIRGGYVRKERLKEGEGEWIEVLIEPYTGQDII